MTMQRQPGRLVSLVGRRGAFLLFLALLDAAFAFGLLRPTAASRQSSTSMFLTSMAPLWFWAIPWAVAGVFCGIFAFRKVDWPGFAAAMAIKALWSLMFLLGWIFVDVERGWISTAIWGAFGLLVALVSGWPEPGPLEEQVAIRDARIAELEAQLLDTPVSDWAAEHEAEAP